MKRGFRFLRGKCGRNSQLICPSSQQLVCNLLTIFVHFIELRNLLRWQKIFCSNLLQLKRNTLSVGRWFNDALEMFVMSMDYYRLGSTESVAYFPLQWYNKVYFIFFSVVKIKTYFLKSFYFFFLIQICPQFKTQVIIHSNSL